MAYHAILTISNIIETKYQEKKKEIEKAERDGKKVKFVEPIEEEKKVVTKEE